MRFAAELFMGRIRVSYDIGNSPGSVVFSYDTVNDGKRKKMIVRMNENICV